MRIPRTVIDGQPSGAAGCLPVINRATDQVFPDEWSGIGVEHALDGLLEFTERQDVHRPGHTTDTALTSPTDD